MQSETVELIIEHTKTKKCDYCDEFANYKMKADGLNSYLCEWCYHNEDDAKQRINEKDE